MRGLFEAGADLDGLVRLIDQRSASADWAGLLRTRNRAISAVRTGQEVVRKDSGVPGDSLTTTVVSKSVLVDVKC